MNRTEATSPAHNTDPAGAPRSVVVVGGGITGLAAAWALEAQAAQPGGTPVEVTLLEADTRLGGKIVTDRVGPLLFERGPDALLLRGPATLQTLDRLGLREQVVTPDTTHRGSYVVRGGRLRALPQGMEGGVPRAAWPMLSTPLLSPRGKLRAALEVGIPRARSVGDESVDAFVRRRFGAEVAERIAAPLLGTVYTNDTRRISLLATLPHLRETERRHGSLLRAAWLRRPRPAAPSASPASPFITLRDGLETLPRHLHASPRRARVRLGTRVAAIQPASQDRLCVQLGDGERLEADRVILATPAFAAASILERASPTAADLLAGVRYASVLIVALAFPPAATAALPAGGGFVVAPGESLLMSACSWTSLRWPHCAPNGELVVRCHVHEDRHPGVLTWDDAAIIAQVRADLRALVGLTPEPLASRVYRWPRSVPSYEVGHLDRLAAASAALSDLPGLILAGAGYRGSGVPECLRQGLEAAAQALA